MCDDPRGQGVSRPVGVLTVGPQARVMTVAEAEAAERAWNLSPEKARLDEKRAQIERALADRRGAAYSRALDYVGLRSDGRWIISRGNSIQFQTDVDKRLDSARWGVGR